MLPPAYEVLFSVIKRKKNTYFVPIFCLTMKIPFKAIAALIILSLIGVFVLSGVLVDRTIYLDEEGYGQLPDRNLTGE